MISEKQEKIYLIGLDNLGNTCYMNSSIQALYAIEELNEYVKQHHCSKPLHKSLGALFNSMDKKVEPNASISPQDFWETFTNSYNQFKDKEQHDAQEFLRYTIDGIHEEVNSVNRKTAKKEWSPKSSEEAWNRYISYVDKSFLVKLFVGQLRSTIKCTHCSHESHCWDTFWDISLSIPETEEECDINDCLEKYTEPEVLDKDAMVTCDQCKEKRKSYKSLSFEKIPLILMIQLKKFENNGKKISKNVKINEMLSIDNTMYSLFSCISHTGVSSSSGHYQSYCKHGIRNIWFRFDDESVYEENEMNWNAMPGAYILLYRMTDKSLKS